MMRPVTAPSAADTGLPSLACAPPPRSLPAAARTAVLVLVAALQLTSTPACSPASTTPPDGRLDVVDVLGGSDVEGFDRAVAPRPFAFPADHGAHPGFAAEWWYFTGNLEDPSGIRFGYQLTFFRTALRPPSASAARQSDWATSQVWMAHFAVTEIDGAAFHAFDRFQRGALGLAGARVRPWHVWLDDWSLEQTGDEPFPARLRAAAVDGDDRRVAIDVVVEPSKPVVLQGEEGLSRKGPSPGNASYYYSFTRLQTAGTVHVDGRDHRVEGSSWLDREWSTSVLESGQVGWDWFAVQLDDGTDLMYYRIRAADGSASPQSAGTLVLADGSYAPLPADDVDLQVLGTWQSPIDGATYPSGWRLSVPDRGIELRIEPALRGQELDLAFRYWEGSVEVNGTGPDRAPVHGRGYVELTGYAGDGLHP
jgi:predicted secreted hydrolase